MEQIEQEKDYIILSSIAMNGFKAMPQDYAFLKRYSLLNIYYEIVLSATAGMPTALLEGVIKDRANSHIDEGCRYGAITEYKESNGVKETKAFLGNNPLYWRTLLKKLKKNVNEYVEADQEDYPAT